MTNLIPILIVALIGCNLSERRAKAVALAYTSTPVEQQRDAWQYVCADDREAKTLEVFERELADLSSAPLAAGLVKGLAELQKETTYTVTDVTLDEAGTSGVVTIAAENEAGGGESEVRVELQDGGWCVSTGWVEEARNEKLASEAEALLEDGSRLLGDWQLDEAEAQIAKAKSMMAEVPEAQVPMFFARSLTAAETLLGARKEGWLGGRWNSKVEQDPMTDQTNAVAVLLAKKALPGLVGGEAETSLVLRCRQGALEAYINAGRTLDSHWRYDTVTFRHRFGDQPAKETYGQESTSRDSVFLRDPGTWLEAFAAFEGEAWRVELPVFGMAPQTAEFDLTASAKAVALVADACE